MCLTSSAKTLLKSLNSLRGSELLPAAALPSPNFLRLPRASQRPAPPPTSRRRPTLLPISRRRPTLLPIFPAPPRHSHDLPAALPISRRRPASLPFPRGPLSSPDFPAANSPPLDSPARPRDYPELPRPRGFHLGPRLSRLSNGGLLFSLFPAAAHSSRLTRGYQRLSIYPRPPRV